MSAAGSQLSAILRPAAFIGITNEDAAALSVPGTAKALDHPHTTRSAVAAEPVSAVPPRPFDPALPIDLGGVDGVTPEEQARAENLLAESVLRLPQWSDPATAEAAGFRSIQDGGTGVEHYVNREFMAMARDHKLLVAGGGDNCVRLLPPLNLTVEEAREAIEKLEQTCETARARAAA